MRRLNVFCLTAAVLVMFGGWARAEERTRFDDFFAPGEIADYDLYVEPGHSGSPRVLDQRLWGSTPIVKRSSDTVSLNGRASLFDFSQPVPIPNTSVVFPDELYSVSGGASYLHKAGDRRQFGGNFSVGSASDKLFNSIHETEFQVTASAMIPSGQRNAWLFLLNYSNNRNFLNNIPLPGLAYIWNEPDHGFRAIIGFPFLYLSWRPDENWNARLSVTGTTNQRAEITRRIVGPLRAFLAYERSPLQWMPAGRADNSDRLIYDEKKTLLGLRSPITKVLSADLSGGRTFDRRMFEDHDAAHSDAPRATLANGWIVFFDLTARWNYK